MKTIAAILLIGLLPTMGMAQGKLGNLKEKAKEKVGSGKEKTTETTNSTTTNSTSNTVGSSASNSVATPGWVNVTEPTFSSGTDYTFTSGIKSDFTPSENFYLRFAFPKSITETIRAIKPNYEKSSAKISLAIGKDENDENPIIVDTRDISLSNYEKYNVVDYTLQADEATIKMIANEPREKVCFTSSSTMGVTTLNEEWRRKAALFKDGKHEWMVFLIFTIPKEMEEGASEIAAQ
jgi:hypothetical protein